MAYIDYGEWFNPFSQQMETVEGVWCECYECKTDVHNRHEVDVFFTKNEYRRHKNERRLAYIARENEKIIRKQELKSAHTKETEAERGHGRPLSVTTLFDLDTGNMVPDPSIDGSVRWETLWRASVREF